jgi:hypothetical protein
MVSSFLGIFYILPKSGFLASSFILKLAFAPAFTRFPKLKDNNDTKDTNDTNLARKWTM